MSVKFVEGFDGVGATQVPDPAWINISVQAGGAGTSRNADTTVGLKQYAVTSGIAGYFNVNGVSLSLAGNGTDDVTWYMGAAVYIDTNTPGLLFLVGGDAGATIHGRLDIANTGIITVWRGNQIANLGTSSAIATGAAWRYVEVRWTLSATVGVVTIFVDGAQVFNASGLNTKNGGTNAWLDTLNWNNLGATRVDDVYIVNLASPGPTTFLGDGRVNALFPTGTGNSTGWNTFGAASNWQCVNDQTYDDDTTYVKTATLNAEDTYAMAALAATTGTPKAVQITIRARKDTTANKSVRIKCRGSTGTEADNGADLALSTSYIFYRTILQDMPGSTGWTIAQVNATQAGQILTVAV